MRNFIKILFVLVLFCLPKTVHAEAVAAGVGDSCECPKLSCNKECEIEQDLTFYSEKCDGGKRVRSCSRPTCVPMANAPVQCMAKSEPAKEVAPVAAPVREVAQVNIKKVAIGKVLFVEGSANRVDDSNEKSKVKMDDEIFEKDRIVTSENGKVQIRFSTGSTLNITPNSEVIITDASDAMPDSDKKQMVLDLIRGKIRNKVEKKYDSEQSYFRVRTKAAVAGVRGTDFVVSYEPEDKNMVSKIETLEGRVELSDKKLENKILVARNEGATFVISKDALFSERDVAEFAAKGFLTPVYKMSQSQIDKLQRETGFANIMAARKTNREVSSEDAPICAGPEGALNQCSWSCENNPDGEKKCRTDLPGVSCVRRICNANGLWSQPTRLPAAFHEACGAGRPVVKSCDY